MRKGPESVYKWKILSTVKKYNFDFRNGCTLSQRFDSVNIMHARECHISIHFVSFMQYMCLVSKIDEPVYLIGWAHKIARFPVDFTPCYICCRGIR